jgi:2-keto-4-pentenoate hydratase/2-oxohepta-3-ene-1,7-dioic acid hydratase in catechol pathway
MRKTTIVICAGLALVFALASAAPGQTGVTKYVRYEAAGRAAYGVLEGDVVRELTAAPWSDGKPTGKTARLTEVRLLAPCEPSKVIAVGLNYKSHLGERAPAAYPGLFAKLPTTIVGPGADIVLPADAQNVHYEGELVVVIGKKTSRVSVADVAAHIFGVTAGNDVSERDWQRSDLQWFRAKGTDTFGPLGPVVVRGLDFNDLLVQTRLNGEVRQSQRTKDLIFGVDEIVSYVSQYVTLMPGDVIYTGTPGTTKAMAAGDVVEIDVEGVGVLRNKVVRGGSK